MPPAPVPINVTPLGSLQQRLEDIYQLDLCQRVDDFVVSDPQLVASLDALASARDGPERLFVCQSGDTLDVSLYISPDVMAALENAPATGPLEAEYLAPLCIALEGVSHFLYLIWCAEHARDVTRMEMEMQAEVDKYVVLALLDLAAGGARPSAGIRRWLFDRARLDPNLDDAERTRYRDASRYAARYCQRLEQGYLYPGRRDALLRELRRFYRAGRLAKLRRIGRLN